MTIYCTDGMAWKKFTCIVSIVSFLNPMWNWVTLQFPNKMSTKPKKTNSKSIAIKSIASKWYLESKKISKRKNIEQKILNIDNVLHSAAKYTVFNSIRCVGKHFSFQNMNVKFTCFDPNTKIGSQMGWHSLTTCKQWVNTKRTWWLIPLIQEQYLCLLVWT